ncbi:MAG TPA: hypothetical protein PKE06_05655 [Flavilitoribacter sp.]|nr:hypothetical protein [Flavilitoribacter sp.]HMQ86116.1 hypothetical protein [Flavilitoribacter sp.]
MKSFKIRHLLAVATVLGATVFSFQGCTKEHIPDPTVYFEEDVFPLIVTNCTKSGCHNAVDREQGYDFTTYNGIMTAVKAGDYKGSPLYTSLVTPFGYMPQDGDRFSDENVALIALWIEQGAANNSGNAGCNTDSVTYNKTVVGIFQGWCYACHSGNNPVGVIRLETYSQVKPYVDNGQILGTIRHDSGFLAMPDGGGKIPSCDIKQIEKWISNGAPDN